MPNFRNGYGAIVYETTNESDLDGFAQFFKSGEVWAASRMLARRVNGTLLIPAVQLWQVYVRTLASLLKVVTEELGLQVPFTVEMGAVGIKDARLGIGHTRQRGRVSDIIHEPELRSRCVLNDIDQGSIEEAVDIFLEDFYDIARVDVEEFRIARKP